MFDDPHVIVNGDGDVLPAPGEVVSMNPHRARGELAQTHDFGNIGKTIVDATKNTGDAKPFSIKDMPEDMPRLEENGSWRRAAARVRRPGV